jgi:hypothetical protein
MKYENIPKLQRDKAEKLLQQGNLSQKQSALLSLALYDLDWKWVQEKCLNYIVDRDEGLLITAIVCLGHVARIHRTIDQSKVLPVLQDLLNENDFKGYASDAIDDISVFVK